MIDVYKLKFKGDNNYFEKTFSNNVDATKHACDIFKNKHIEIYRKRKYHKLSLVITEKNQWSFSVRCGSVNIGMPASIDFFKMMFGHNRNHINYSNEFNNFM